MPQICKKANVKTRQAEKRKYVANTPKRNRSSQEEKKAVPRERAKGEKIKKKEHLKRGGGGHGRKLQMEERSNPRKAKIGSKGAAGLGGKKRRGRIESKCGFGEGTSSNTGATGGIRSTNWEGTINIYER